MILKQPPAAYGCKFMRLSRSAKRGSECRGSRAWSKCIAVLVTLSQPLACPVLLPEARIDFDRNQRWNIPVDHDCASRKFCADHESPNELQSLKRFAALIELGERNSHHASLCNRAEFRRSQRPELRQRVAWWIRAFSGSLSFVAVVQATDLRHRHDRSHFRRLYRSWLR